MSWEDILKADERLYSLANKTHIGELIKEYIWEDTGWADEYDEDAVESYAEELLPKLITHFTTSPNRAFKNRKGDSTQEGKITRKQLWDYLEFMLLEKDFKDHKAKYDSDDGGWEPPYESSYTGHIERRNLY